MSSIGHLKLRYGIIFPVLFPLNPFTVHFHVITLFPELFEAFQKESIIGRAIQDEKVSLDLVNLRDFGLGKHRQVDDTPYGGGEGMLMMCEPIFSAFEHVILQLQLRSQKSKIRKGKTRRIFLTPQGEKFTQGTAERLSKYDDIVLLCGRYEGVDQRVRDTLIDEEISIGDYVLTGGELPAMVLMDSVIRLLPGVLGKEGSHQFDSFSKAFDGKKEHPHYTKPAEFQPRGSSGSGLKVPEVLLSGNHGEIEKWRREHLK